MSRTTEAAMDCICKPHFFVPRTCNLLCPNRSWACSRPIDHAGPHRACAFYGACESAVDWPNYREQLAALLAEIREAGR